MTIEQLRNQLKLNDLLINRACPAAYRPTQDAVQLCSTCLKNLKAKTLPALCYDTCPLPLVPEAIARLNSTSVRLIAIELPFTKITTFSTFQSEFDSAIYVPALISSTAHRLPREDNQAEVIQVPNSLIAPSLNEPNNQQQVRYEQIDRAAIVTALQ